MKHPTTIHAPQVGPNADAFGRLVAARLSESESDIDRDCAERLRAAREQAIARRKLPAILRHAPVVAPVIAPDLAFAGSGGLPLPHRDGVGFWTRLASLLPLVALVAGLWAIHGLQNQHRAAELADVDAAILTDDLPPAAYADPGFLEFLHAGDVGASETDTPQKD